MLKARLLDAYADNRFSLRKAASQDSSLRVLDGDFAAEAIDARGLA